MLKSVLANPKTFIRFVAFGGLTSVFCLIVAGIIYSLYPQLGFVTINVIAGVLGIFVNFTMNFMFNFGGPAASKDPVDEFVRFFAVALLALLLALVLSSSLEFIVHLLAPESRALNESLVARSAAHGLVLAVVAVISYGGHVLITFRKRSLKCNN